MITVELDTEKLSALYDRIYDIADRLIKKYNPCNIQTKDNKTKCINSNYKHNSLCCGYYSERCKHWQDGCTIKCLPCKLFACGAIRGDKKNNNFIRILSKLRRITSKHGLSNFDYYITKKKVLQNRSK